MDEAHEHQWLDENHQRLVAERLQRHAGETGHQNESLLETLDRIMLDHEKMHHGTQ